MIKNLAFDMLPKSTDLRRNLLSGFAISTIGLSLFSAGISPTYAQSINLGTAGSFGVLAGATVTNTGPTVITGDVGVFPGTAIVGFPPGGVNPPFAIHAGNAVAGQAQSDLTTAYNALAGTATTADLSGQDLGNGRTLTPGVYNFGSSAQLTGALTLNAAGNPNALFIFNIASTLTTASASRISLIGGAQGQNVFFRVGSSATLGTDTSFVGDIIALTSITLNTGANITCGAALARNGAVTLDNNRILIPRLAQCLAPLLPPVVVVPPVGVPPGVIPPVVVPPGAVPPAVVVVPPGVVIGPVAAVTDAINNAFLDLFGDVPIPQAILDLASLSPAAQALALSQLAGEGATAIAPASTQAMNSFLRLVLNPFAGGPFADNRFQPNPNDNVVRALGYAANQQASMNSPFDSRTRPGTFGLPDPRRLSIWGAVYGDHNKTSGGTLAHDRTVGSASFAAGLDYRVTPDTVIGFALAGGGTDYDIAEGLGGGSSDMFQAAVYSFTRFDAAYVAAALAYAGHWGSTERELTFLDGGRLTSSFFANTIGGRIETGYRFAVPDILGLAEVGFTPYVAAQAQSFMMPSYRERGDFGSSPFALAYDSRTTNTVRTELGAWFDRSIALEDATLVLRGRVAWAHDYFNDPTVHAAFQALPGSDFTLSGAEPTKNSALVSAGAWVRLDNGLSLGAKLDGEFAAHSQTYAATGIVRYTW